MLLKMEIFQGQLWKKKSIAKSPQNSDFEKQIDDVLVWKDAEISDEEVTKGMK